jgi:shikimate dehydrogenase
VLARPANADVLVNCTSVGLPADGAVVRSATELHALNQLALSPDQVGEYRYVIDLVYTRRPTALLEAARARGAHTVDGLEVLLAQGALSFKLWTGLEPPLEVMRAAAQDR